MNAVLSGRAGTAFLVDGGRFLSMHLGGAPPVERRAEDFPQIFADVSDLELLEDIDLGRVERTLALAVGREEALDLALVLLDGEIPDPIREEAASDLDARLDDGQIHHALEGLLYSRPLPPDADAAGALRCAHAGRHVAVLVEELVARQANVRSVRAAWQSAAERVIPSAPARDNAEGILVRAGLFRDLAEVADDPDAVNRLYLRALQNGQLIRLPAHHQILQEVLGPFRGISSALRIGLEHVSEGEEPSQTRQREPRGFDRGEVLKKVERQKESISDLLRQRDLDRARSQLGDLIEYQLRNGGPKYASMSLCDLAMTARRLGQHSVDFELTKRATELQPEDGWAWAQHAKALLNAARLEAALVAYDEARRFGSAAVGLTGRAEILKAMGRLDESLEAYQETSRQHPEDVFAKTGRAEVLKAMGRLDESLEAYQETSRQHPEDIFAKTGRAEVLKAMGRLDESLEAYQETSRQHPEDVFAKTGRAEVLKAMGSLDESLEAYQETSRQHPEDVVAKNGRAEILKAMGRLDESLEAYQETSRQHPEDIFAKTGRAEVLKAMGRLDESLEAYQETSRQHPEDVVAKTGRAEVLKAMGRLDESLEAYQETSRQHPEDVVAKNGRAKVLKAMGRLDESLEAYRETSRQHPEDVVAKTGRASVLVLLGRIDAALDMLPAGPPRTAQEWIAEHVRAMALLQAGRIRASVEHLERGVASCPFAGQRDYFRAAIAVARLRLRRYDEAREAIESVTDASLRRQTAAIRVHAEGMLEQHARAVAAYAELPPPLSALDRELYDELRRRFVDREAPAHDDDWLLEREVHLLLMT